MVEADAQPESHLADARQRAGAPFVLAGDQPEHDQVLGVGAADDVPFRVF